MTAVAEIMSTNPVTARTDDSLKHVVSLMIERVIGTVYVVDEANIPVGVYTERELLQDLVTTGKVSVDAKVRDKMSGAVIRIAPETSVLDAARIMISGKGRLAVTKNSVIVGVVTASDLVRAFSEGAENRSIGKNIVSPKVKILDSGRTILDAVQMMNEKRIGSVVVTKEAKPIGIFTERDLLKLLGADMEKSILDVKLVDVATKPLITANVGITAREAASLMKSNKIKRLPLLKGEELVGIVTARDLVETYATIGLPTVQPTAPE